MKIIKCLAEKIEEEMNDAEAYAKLAYKYRSDYPELSDVFLTLSRQEVTHLNMLHTQAERLIKEYQASGKEIPPAMQAVWEWEHDRMMDGMTRIKTLQDMIR